MCKAKRATLFSEYVYSTPYENNWMERESLIDKVSMESYLMGSISITHSKTSYQIIHQAKNYDPNLEGHEGN